MTTVCVSYSLDHRIDALLQLDADVSSDEDENNAMSKSRKGTSSLALSAFKGEEAPLPRSFFKGANTALPPPPLAGAMEPCPNAMHPSLYNKKGAVLPSSIAQVASEKELSPEVSEQRKALGAQTKQMAADITKGGEAGKAAERRLIWSGNHIPWGSGSLTEANPFKELGQAMKTSDAVGKQHIAEFVGKFLDAGASIPVQPEARSELKNHLMEIIKQAQQDPNLQSLATGLENKINDKFTPKENEMKQWTENLKQNSNLEKALKAVQLTTGLKDNIKNLQTESYGLNGDEKNINDKKLAEAKKTLDDSQWEIFSAVNNINTPINLDRADPKNIENDLSRFLNEGFLNIDPGEFEAAGSVDPNLTPTLQAYAERSNAVGNFFSHQIAFSETPKKTLEIALKIANGALEKGDANLAYIAAQAITSTAGKFKLENELNSSNKNIFKRLNELTDFSLNNKAINSFINNSGNKAAFLPMNIQRPQFAQMNDSQNTVSNEKGTHIDWAKMDLLADKKQAFVEKQKAVAQSLGNQGASRTYDAMRTTLVAVSSVMSDDIIYFKRDKNTVQEMEEKTQKFSNKLKEVESSELIFQEKLNGAYKITNSSAFNSLTDKESGENKQLLVSIRSKLGEIKNKEKEVYTKLKNINKTSNLGERAQLLSNYAKSREFTDYMRTLGSVIPLTEELFKARSTVDGKDVPLTSRLKPLTRTVGTGQITFTNDLGAISNRFLRYNTLLADALPIAGKTGITNAQLTLRSAQQHLERLAREISPE